MGNIHGNCINVDSVVKSGATVSAVNQTDFLSANDAWFMPVVQKTGPDGSLYILDWYDRYHCYQDANRDPAGIDRLKGRLYRVRYKDTPRRANFDLAKASDDELIGSCWPATNVYDRDIAQRLISERDAGRGHDHRRVARGRAAPPRGRPGCTPSGRSSARGRWSRHSTSSCWPMPIPRSVPGPSGRRGTWTLVDGLPGREDTPAAQSPQSARSGGTPDPRSRGPETPEPRDLRDRVRDGERQVPGGPPPGRDRGAEVPDVRPSPRPAGRPQPHRRRRSDLAGRRLAESPAVAGTGSGRVRLLEATSRAFGGSRAVARIFPRAIDRLLAMKSPDPGRVRTLAKQPAGRAAGRPRPGACEVVESITAKVQSGEISGPRSEALRDSVGPLLTGFLDKHPGDGLQHLKRSVRHARRVVEGPGAGWPRPGEHRLDGPTSPKLDASQALAALVAAGRRQRADRRRPASWSSPAIVAATLRGKSLAAIARVDNPGVADAVLQAYPATDAATRSKIVELLTQRPAWTRTLIAAVDAKTIPASARERQPDPQAASDQGSRARRAREEDLRHGPRGPQPRARRGHRPLSRPRPEDARRPDGRARRRSPRSAASATRFTAKGRRSVPILPATAATISSSSCPTSSTPAS